MRTMVAVAVLLGLNLGLLWLLFAAPVGLRTIRLVRRFAAPPARVLAALDPFGPDATWSKTVLSSVPVGDGAAQAGLVDQTYDFHDRKGEPVRRRLMVERSGMIDAGEMRLTIRVIEDSTLDPVFWQAFRDERTLRAADDGGSELTVTQTDRYRGIAFLVFRRVALSRELASLHHWLETGAPRRRAWYDGAPAQVLLSVLSTLVLWPFFGLTGTGLLLASLLTVVIALHEFGHMLAYRATGHRSARMILIPLLGGVAIGGRPYDRLFEVAFCALMGAGLSCFPVALSILAYPYLASAAPEVAATAPVMLLFLLICGAFNLLNLVPVSRFDGGQVLRQVFRTRRAQALGTVIVAAPAIAVGWRVGLPPFALMGGLAVLTLMSLITGRSRSVRPRSSLEAMTGAERALIFAGLVAAIAVHGAAIVFAADRLFA